MGRAVFGLLLGFVLVFGVALWARTCLPDPNDDDIEWLEREDAIIIQKKSVFTDKLPFPWYAAVDAACGVPEFTLYGDGTLIFRQPAAMNERLGVATDYSGVIYRAKLDHGQIEDLLGELEDDGFFNFAYRQPGPSPTNSPLRGALSTTYLYAKTKLAANAVSAYGINFLGAPVTGGEQWDEYRKLTQITGRLDETTTSFVGGDYRTPEPLGQLLVVQPIEGQTPDPPVPWDGSFSIADLAPGTDLAARKLEDADRLPTPSREAPQTLLLGGRIVEDEGRTFYYCTRPVLPYEENFPEFEPPTDLSTDEPTD